MDINRDGVKFSTNLLNANLSDIKAYDWFSKINTNAVSETEQEYIDKLLTTIALNNVQESVTFSDLRLVYVATKLLINNGMSDTLLPEYGLNEYLIYYSYLTAFYDVNTDGLDEMKLFVTYMINNLHSSQKLSSEENKKLVILANNLLDKVDNEDLYKRTPDWVITAIQVASRMEVGEVVTPIENSDVQNSGLEEREPEVKGESTEGGESESQVKELQDAIETFQFLIEAGASEEEVKELQEAVETFQFLIETLGGTSEEQPIAKEENGEKETYYIEFLNKEKSFQKDTKEFDSYEEAENWAKENFENFNPDMIRMKFAKGGKTSKSMECYITFLGNYSESLVDKVYDALEAEGIQINASKKWHTKGYAMEYIYNNSLGERNYMVRLYISDAKNPEKLLKKLEYFDNKYPNFDYTLMKEKFAKGGEVGKFAEGGKTLDELWDKYIIADQYEGRKPEDIWARLRPSQRRQLILDHANVENNGELRSYVDWDTNFDDLPHFLQLIVKKHFAEGQYAKGGEVSNELVEYTIPTWAVSSLINGDDSGLEDEDIEKIDNFIQKVLNRHGNALFMLGDKSEESDFSPYNDIDNLGSDVTTLYIRPSKNFAKGGTTKKKFKKGDKVVGQFRYEYGEGLQPVSLYDYAERVNGVISDVKKIDTTTMYSIKFDNGEELKYPDFAIDNFIIHSQYAQGGEISNKFRGVDLFEDYDLQEPKLRKIVKKINDAFEEDEVSTQFLQERLDEAEAIGYTFEIDMDGSAYGLRPTGVEITDLEGYEEYATGGSVPTKPKYEKGKKVSKPFYTKNEGNVRIPTTEGYSVENKLGVYGNVYFFRYADSKHTSLEDTLNSANEFYEITKDITNKSEYEKISNDFFSEYSKEYFERQNNEPVVIDENKIENYKFTGFKFENLKNTFGIPDEEFRRLNVGIDLTGTSTPKVGEKIIKEFAEKYPEKYDTVVSYIMSKRRDRENFYATGGEVEKKNENWKKFVLENRSWFDDESENVDGDEILLTTREHGDVGNEQWGKEDLNEAKQIIKTITSKFPETQYKIEQVDEFVYLYLKPSKSERELQEEKELKQKQAAKITYEERIVNELGFSKEKAAKIVENLSKYPKEYYEKNKDKKIGYNNAFTVLYTSKTEFNNVKFNDAKEVFDYITNSSFASGLSSKANPIIEVVINLYGWDCLRIKYNTDGFPFLPDGETNYTARREKTLSIYPFLTANIGSSKDLIDNVNKAISDFIKCYEIVVLEIESKKQEPKENNETQLKELQDAIETFEFLIQSGATKQQAKELKEAKETFQFLLETLGGGQVEKKQDQNINKEDMDVKFIEYKDNEIMYEPSLKKYYANDEEFDSLEQAKKFLDSGKISDSVRGAYKRGLYAEGGEVKKYTWIAILRKGSEQKVLEVEANNEAEARIEVQKAREEYELSKELFLYDLFRKYAKGGQVASIGDSGIITDKNSLYVGKLALIMGVLDNMYEVNVGGKRFMVRKNKINIIPNEEDFYAKGGKTSKEDTDKPELSYWNQQAALLNGLTIDLATYKTGSRKERLGLEEDTPVIMAGGSKYLIPLLDDEGNGSGVFYVVQPNGIEQIFEPGNGSDVYIKQRSMLFNLLITGVKTKKTIKNAIYVDKTKEFGLDNPVLQITLSDNTKIYVLRDAEMNGVGSLVVFDGINGSEFMLPRISFDDLKPENDIQREEKPINLKDLEGNWSLFKDGRKEEGYVTIKNEGDLSNYITKKLGHVVLDIKLIERGKNYPDNPTNPYFEDTYLVTLKNGNTFEIRRTYGKPNWSGNVSYEESIEVKNEKKGNITPIVREEDNQSVKEDSKTQLKELQDAVETFAFLLEAGVTKEQEKELKEAIEIFKFLINDLKTSLKIAKGSQQKQEKKKEGEEKKEAVSSEVDLKDVYNDLKKAIGSGLKITTEKENYINSEIRDWGNWEHDYEDYERDEEDFEDDDFMILSSDSITKLSEIIKGLKTKYPSVSVKFETSEKNYIDFHISRKLA